MDEAMHCNVSTGYNDIKSKQVVDCPGSEEIQEHKQFKLLRMTFKIAKYYVIKVKSLLQTAFVKEVEKIGKTINLDQTRDGFCVMRGIFALQPIVNLN